MDFQGLMKQAQLVQQKFQEAQEKMQQAQATGTSGGGLVSVELMGTHQIKSIKIDESLMVQGEADVLSDLVRAAHADAHKKLEAQSQELLKEATGGLGAGGGLPNMPKFF